MTQLSNAQRVAHLNVALAALKKVEKAYDPTAPNWEKALYEINLVKNSLQPVTSNVPALGPIVKGGPSILKYDCTHLTAVVGWPAFDHVADPGTPVVAPENCIVYDNTSGAQGGDAFYIRGKSGMRYWVGHITTVPNQGRLFTKGQTMTYISSDHPLPHVHLGIDAVPLIGHKLISHTDYSHGAPLIGVQLARALDS